MSDLIRREYHGHVIRQREDGYMDLTAMAKANGKKVSHYLGNKRTKDFVAALSANAGIPALNLVVAEVGGGHVGTWGHPRVVCHMAQWCSPEFEVLVSGWVDDIRTRGVAVDERRVGGSSPAQVALAMAQALVALETSVEGLKRAASDLEGLANEHGTRLARIEARHDAARLDLVEVVRSDSPAPVKSLRAKINELVRAYCFALGADHREVWGKLYRELRSRCAYDARIRAEHRDCRPLDACELDGMLEALFSIASEILTLPQSGGAAAAIQATGQVQ